MAIINKPSQQLVPAEIDPAVLDGKADLVNGAVPSNQLPSYVDDVLEFADADSFPEEGETGKIYVALDTNSTYRWSGAAYIQVGGGTVAASLEPLHLQHEFDVNAEFAKYTWSYTVPSEYIASNGTVEADLNKIIIEQVYDDNVELSDSDINDLQLYRVYGNRDNTSVSFAGTVMTSDVDKGGALIIHYANVMLTFTKNSSSHAETLSYLCVLIIKAIDDMDPATADDINTMLGTGE